MEFTTLAVALVSLGLLCGAVWIFARTMPRVPKELRNRYQKPTVSEIPSIPSAIFTSVLILLIGGVAIYWQVWIEPGLFEWWKPFAVFGFMSMLWYILWAPIMGWPIRKQGIRYKR